MRAVSLVLTAGIFVLDLQTPLGIPIWFLYLIPILLLSRMQSRRFPLALAGLCSILAWGGLYFSPPGAPFSLAMANRLLGIPLFWAVALIDTAVSQEVQSAERLAWGMSRRTIANLACVCLIALLLASVRHRVSMETQDVAQGITHAHDVLNELAATRASLTDAAAGHQRFLLTGEDQDLASTRQAVAEVRVRVERLNSLMEDRTIRKAKIPAAGLTVEEWLAELENTIGIRQTQGLDATVRLARASYGKAMLGNLRGQLDEMEGGERAVLAQQQEHSAILSHAQTAMQVFGVSALAGLMVLLVLLLNQEQRNQRAFAGTLRQMLATLDATLDGIFVVDPRTLRFSYVNEGALLQIGYGRDELLRMTPLDIEPEFDEPRFRAMIEPLVSGAQTSQSFTTVHRRNGGVDIPVEVNLQCVDPGTSQARLIAVVRDITERQQVSARLDEEVRRFRNIFESAPVSIWEEDWTDVIAAVGSLKSQGVADVERYCADHQEVVAKLLRMVKLVDVNPQTCTMFEAATKDQLLTSLSVVFSTEDTLPGFVSELAALAGGSRIFQTEMSLRTVRGRLIQVLLTMTFPEASNPRERVFVSMMDITARKRAEEVQQRLAAIVASSDDAIISKTLDGIVTSWNAGAERVLGYRAEDMIGAPMSRIIPPEKLEEEAGILECLRRGEHLEHFETVRKKQDGTLLDISLTLSPIKEATGAITGISTIARDITERKRVEKELKRYSRLLEAANKELEAFSYSVSHDLRAPVRSLNGFSQALLEDCSARLDEQGKDYLNRIRAASQRMGQLIDDLLRLSRLTRAELRREPVDVSALAASGAAEVRRQWPGRQVELSIEPGLTDEADRRLLGIVFDNLLSNAWKFTSQRERAVIEVGAVRREGETAYFVRDNGAGFDMAYAGKLFGVFQRLHTVTEFPGTGIGLATVQRIVHRHGGRVWAEGRIGEGAAFYFTLGR